MKIITNLEAPSPVAAAVQHLFSIGYVRTHSHNFKTRRAKDFISQGFPSLMTRICRLRHHWFLQYRVTLCESHERPKAMLSSERISQRKKLLEYNCWSLTCLGSVNSLYLDMLPFERLVAWAPSECIQAKIQSINHPKGIANFRTDPNFMESAADSWHGIPTRTIWTASCNFGYPAGLCINR